jgi:hypothetical protein
MFDVSKPGIVEALKQVKGSIASTGDRKTAATIIKYSTPMRTQGHFIVITKSALATCRMHSGAVFICD